jgi:ADP-ribosylation factor related protein 1
MFSLLYGLLEWVLRKDELHMLILGIDKAGKTNLLERVKATYSKLVALDPSKILPTVGLNVGRIEAFNSHLIFWDLGGQPGLRSIWDKYYDESHGIIFVVDATTPSRFEESKRALDKVLGSRELFDTPLLIFANKQDAPGAVDAQEVAASLGVGKADARSTKVQRVSGHTGEGVHEGLTWLVSQIKVSARLQRLRQKR